MLEKLEPKEPVVDLVIPTQTATSNSDKNQQIKLFEPNSKVSLINILLRSSPHTAGLLFLASIPAAISKEITIYDYADFPYLFYKNFLEETSSLGLGFMGILAIAVTFIVTFIKAENSDEPNEF